MGVNFLRRGWNQDVDVMMPQLLAWQAWHSGFENRYVPQQKFQGHSGKCVYPGVLCLIRLFFFCKFFKVYRTFLQTIIFLCVFLTKHFQFLTSSHPLIFTPFYLKKLSSSHLQIFSSSYPHTFSFANTHMPKSPNLDICSVKFSNILASSSSNFFFILQISRPINRRSSQFHTLSSAASRQKTNSQQQRFPVLLLGKNRTTGAKNLVPIDSKGMRSQGRKKNLSQCCFNPKTDLQDTAHFFQCGEKLVRAELTMRLQRGEEKGGPVLLFEAKNKPTGRERSAPPETLFITS